MQNDLTESVQASIRPGEMVDTMYYGETNLEKQAYPAVCNTRFVQAFTNLGAGSSQFVISPAMGISDIVLQFVTPANAVLGTYTGLALNAGWGYSLINRVSVRYGSSSQYFWSGSQVLLQNLIEAENNFKADTIVALGGTAGAGVNLASAGGCGTSTALVYLKLPHNSVRASGKPLPFPSDLLVQPIVVTVELFSLASIMVQQVGGAIATAPVQLALAQMQVKQETLTDSSDQLARRVDMNTNAYTYPLSFFCQQETQVQVTTSATSLTNTVNLTGFRAGEVKSIILWLTLAGATQTAGSGSYAPQTWVQISNLQLQYNGEIFTRYDGASSAMWGLIGDQKALQVNTATYTAGGAAGAVATLANPWVECPFAQVNVPNERDMKLVHGKPILNAVVNLQFDAPNFSTQYIVHAMYLYNASLLCSRGSAEYIF